MKCQGDSCRFYESTNPFGSRSHCRAAECEQDKGLVFCDEIENCKWFKPTNDTRARLERLERKVFGDKYVKSML